MPNIESHTPPLSDYQRLFKHLKQQHISIESFLPPHLIQHQHALLALQGSPLNQLTGAMMSCGVGLFLYVLGGRLAKQCTSLELLEQYTLAASPLMVGGLLRIWAAAQTDAGYGKESMIKLLSLSLIGVLGHVLFLSFNPDLSQLQSDSFEYPFLIVCNVLSGLGIATYSAGMTLGACAAPNDTPERWQAHLHRLSELLGFELRPTCLEQQLAVIVRSNAAQYLAMIAGMSNLAPGLALIASVFLIPELGLRNTYLFFAGMTALGILGTKNLVHDAPYDQLIHQYPELSHEKAKELAIFCGQSRFSSEKGFWTTVFELDKKESYEVLNATFDYTITFGVLTAMTSMGVIMLNKRHFSAEEASLIIAGVSMISAAMRTLMTLCPPKLTPKQLVLSSFSAMLVLTVFFAIEDDKQFSSISLILFGIINGIGNFAVVAGIAETLPEKIGLATGISSGIAAFLAFPMSIGMAYSQWFAPSLCAFGLGVHMLEYTPMTSAKVIPLI